MSIFLTSKGILLTKGGIATGVNPPASASYWNNTQYTQTTPDGLTISLNNTAGAFTTYPCYGGKVITSNVYWELVPTTPSSSTGCAVSIGPLGGSDTEIGPILQWHEDGTLWSDGGYENDGSWASWSTGNTLCFAVDFTNLMIYGRVGPTGNWNNNASANPSTNTGGLAIPTSIVTAGIVVGGVLYETNNTILGNFTSGTFSGTPPSGFSPLFP